MLQLSIQDYDGKSTLIPLTEGEFTIGRDESSSICLTERNVSRHHCKITAQSGAVFIENLAATWGTRVNNLLLRERATFHVGDVIQIGDYVLELVGDGGGKRDTALRDGPAPEPSGSPQPPPDNATAIVNLADIQSAISAPSDASGIPVAEQPRLVVESENLRGLEFRVTKSPTVVGRVPESADLVVDHRSISKEHARLTRRADGSWEVLDLGSANGIQVNGEPYSKSDVNSADTLTFGHVTMRFLAAGAKAPPIGASASSSGGNKGLLIGVVALLLLLAGGAAAFFAIGGDSKKDLHKKKDAVEKAAPVKVDEDEPKGDEPEKPNVESVAQRLLQIEKLRKADMRAEALKIAKAAKAEHEGSPEIALVLEELEGEVEALKSITQLKAKIDTDPKDACDQLSALVESMKGSAAIKKKAADTRKMACDTFLQSLIDACASEVRKKNWEGAIDKCEMALSLDDSNVRASELKLMALKGKQGGGAAATPDPPTAKPKERKPRKVREPRRKERKPREAKVAPKPKPKPKPEPAKAMSGKEYYKAGRNAALHGDKKQAISLLKKAVVNGYPRANGALAKLLFQTGDKGGCLRHGKKYLRRYPDAGDADQIEGMLEKCK